MAKPFKGTINVDIRDSEPDWTPFEPPVAPYGAPNVVYIVLDDVGFSAMDCYGGPIETPNINRIAAQGVRYTQWHTTALCSPTRSCLLTGRNHTRNSMACITEAATGFPNASGTIPPENGMISEILGERGWNTYMTGKWHLCPEAEMNVASPRRNWPTGRGFERFYGFLGAETNQWFPDLVYDNHPVDQPKSPEEGYHLTDDLTDKALEFIKDAKVIAPDKPFFLYYAPGACHAPHHAPKEWIERFRGRFDMGYEALREQTLARQKEMGIVPPDTDLPPVNPLGTMESHTDPRKQMNEMDTTRPWDSLSADEKRLFSRMAEVYAGFLAHADHHIGRLLDYLEETGQLDNTLVILVSDNGASGEGGPNGSVNENKMANGIPDDITENLAKIDELGTPLAYNHYPTGWAMAFNSPFKMWKRYEFNGHALYIKDNRLHYTYNFVGSAEQRVIATEEVPVGVHLILSASFGKDGEDPPGTATGILSLYHADQKVGEARIKTQPGKFSIAGEGLCVGRDSGEPVTDDYLGKAPWRFTGGTIKRVIVNVSGKPYVDLEREAIAMMTRE